MSPDTTADPYALFNHLSLMADPRRAAHLAMFLRLCEEHHARGNLDFRPVTIAALSEAESGYCYGSLRNASGKPYRQLIAAFARSVGGWTHRPPKGKMPQWKSVYARQSPTHLPRRSETKLTEPPLPAPDRLLDLVDLDLERRDHTTKATQDATPLLPTLERAVRTFSRIMAGGALMPLPARHDADGSFFSE